MRPIRFRGTLNMRYIFGPVPSRRLGLSLGVDLIPHKTCTFDCLYCEVGRTTNKTITTGAFVPANEILDELGQRLSECSPDVITLAGSGEPTLHSEIDHIISGIRALTPTQIVVLTNGSLFWDEAVRSRVLGADLIMPTPLHGCFTHISDHPPPPRGFDAGPHRGRFETIERGI